MQRYILHNEHTIDTPAGSLAATIRRGMKWTNRAVPGAILELCECERGVASITHTTVGEGTIVDVWNGRFQDIPARMIELMHRKEDRLYSKLLENVREKYFTRDFEEKQFVTVMIYRRTR